MTISYPTSQKVHDGGDKPLTVQDVCEAICGHGRIIYGPQDHNYPVAAHVVMSEIDGVQAITISFVTDS